MTPTYCKLVDGGYLRLELITSKSTIQRAEQMTFTRGQLRRLITHFHKVVELVCQTGAAHKHWNNNDSNLLEKSHTMGGFRDEVFWVTFYAVKLKVLCQRRSESSSGLWYFFGGDELTD